jgi:hypothetical protein
MRTRMKALAALSAALVVLTGCVTIAPPDQVGLYYLEGQDDGYKFSKCIEPGDTGDPEWNNSVIYLETNLRTWTIDGQLVNGAWVPAPGADSGEEIVVSAKPEENQPSGVQIRVATKAGFFLNTYCDSDGGVVKPYWEKIGRRYKADTEQGWKDLLNAEFVPIQKTVIRDVIRGYSADPFIANANGVQAEAQKLIAERLAAEFNRLSGGNFFCGPSFNRKKPDCPQLELLIIGAEYADAGIQAARNEKQKAIELAAAQLEAAKGAAAALVAEANGKRDAANAVRDLYNSPGWVQLQMQILQLEAVKACGANPNCHMFVGNSGAQIFSTR